MHWIKAEINEYVIRNWRIVKIATTKAQRKLFFKLRGLTPGTEKLRNEDIERISKILAVNEKDIATMEERMNAPDKSVDTIADPITQNNYNEFPQFADRSDPLLLLQESESTMLLKNGLTRLFGVWNVVKGIL